MKIRTNVRAGIYYDRCGGTRCGGSTRCGGTRCGGSTRCTGSTYERAYEY